VAAPMTDHPAIVPGAREGHLVSIPRARMSRIGMTVAWMELRRAPTTLDRGRRPPRLPAGRWLSPLDPVSAPSGRPPHQPRRDTHHAHSATGLRPLARRQRHPHSPAMPGRADRGGRGPGGTTNRLHQQGQVISRGAYLLRVRFDHDNQLISMWPHLVRDLDTRDGD